MPFLPGKSCSNMPRRPQPHCFGPRFRAPRVFSPYWFGRLCFSSRCLSTICFLALLLAALPRTTVAQDGSFLGLRQFMQNAQGVRTSGLDAPPPPRAEKGFSLTSIQIHGDLMDDRPDHVNLAIEITARIYSSGMQTIPLRLSQCVLLEAPEYSNTEIGQLVDFDAARGGFLWLLEDKSASLSQQREFKLKLKMSAPVTRSDDRDELQLRLPTSLASHLALRVPRQGVNAMTLRGEEPTIETTDAGSTIGLADLEEDLALRWWASAPAATSAPYLVDSEIETLIDPARQLIRHDAVFKIETLGGAHDVVRIELPRGFKLISTTPPQTSANQLSNLPPGTPPAEVPDDGSAETAPRVIEVSLLGNEPLRVIVERTLENFESVPLNPFTFPEALRQSGVWNVRAAEGWYAVAQDIPAGFAQLEGPGAAGDATKLLPGVAESQLAFRFWETGHAPAIRVFRPRTVVTVQPMYRVFANSTYLELEAALALNVSSGKLHNLAIDLGPWQVEGVRLEDGESSIPGYLDAAGVLHLPFARPLTNRARLHLSATLDVTDPAHVRFALPVLEDCLVRDGVLQLAGVNGWELHSDLPGCVGLELDAASAAAGTTQTAAAMNTAAEKFNLRQTPWQFAGTLHRTTRFTSRSETRATLDERSLHVKQQLTLTANGELNDFRLRLPRELWRQRDAVQLTISAGGQALEVREATPTETPAATSGAVAANVTLQVIGPLPRATGDAQLSPSATTHTLDVSYSLPWEGGAQPSADSPTSSATDLPLTLWLALPLGGEFQGQSVSLDCPAEIRPALSADEVNWSPATSSGTSSGPMSAPYRYRAEKETPSLALHCSHAAPSQSRQVITDLVIHSWLGREFREDRAMFLWQPDVTGELVIRLPDGASSSELLLRRNGENFSPTLQGNKLRITAGGGSAAANSPGIYGAPQAIEVIYRIPNAAGHYLRLTAPDFGPDVWIGHTFWQLTLPAGQNIVWTGGELQPDAVWSWSSAWQNQPRLSLADLERQVHAVISPALPAATNQYLFSGTGEPQSLRIYMAPRSWLVGLASLVTLGAGLALLSFPRLRRPWILLVTLVVLAALVTIFQGISLLVIQASLLGFVLLLIALGLRWLLQPRSGAPGSRRTSGDDSQSRASTLDRSGPPSTTARPLASAGRSS